MIEIYKILQCPLCRSNITESLECQRCGEKYLRENDVYVMLNKKLSKNEWKWDEKQFTEERQNASGIKYRSFLNEATVKAHKVWFEAMDERIKTFHGTVCDYATGLGTLFNNMVKPENDFLPFATDVDPNVLAWNAKRIRVKGDMEFASVAMDGKHAAFVDDTFDCLTSLAALGNIPDTRAALSEMHRVLKKGGRFVIMNHFINKWSRSHWLAKLFKVERGIVEQYLLEDMKSVGFRDCRVHIISSAVWARNPMDGLPIAGDMNHYAIVEARK